MDKPELLVGTVFYDPPTPDEAPGIGPGLLCDEMGRQIGDLFLDRYGEWLMQQTERVTFEVQLAIVES